MVIGIQTLYVNDAIHFSRMPLARQCLGPLGRGALTIWHYIMNSKNTNEKKEVLTKKIVIRVFLR
jgi:hypothetical protein